MRSSKDAKTARAPGARGAERYVLAMALLVPLAIIVLVLGHLPWATLASPSGAMPAEASMVITGKRPVSSDPAPPPTLAPATATPRPTATAVPQPSATPHKGDTYVVQAGDELKRIAADHNVSINKIIAANDIPNPDSLRIGQELRIPTE